MLPALEGFAAALLGGLDAPALAGVVADLESFERTVRDRGDLRAVLTDTSISAPARGLVTKDLLEGKVREDSLRLLVYAASSGPAQDVPHALSELAFVGRGLRDNGELTYRSLGLLDARRRVAGFADEVLESVDTASFTSIEDDLFRWARTVEANEALRHLLLDRDAPLEARVGLTDQLLTGKVHPVALALARYCEVGGRPRDLVGTLDYLVNYVAEYRGWRVARVFSARALDAESQEQLITSLRTLTGKPVELEIDLEPELLGGVLVEIGDLRLDATTRGRLGALRESVTSGSSGRAMENFLQQRND